MNEYGEIKTLEEILLDLTKYCALNFVTEANIKVVLPDEIVDQFALSFKKKTKYLPGSSYQFSYSKDFTMFFNGGTVKIVRQSDEK
jgi:hypothetical protein